MATMFQLLSKQHPTSLVRAFSSSTITIPTRTFSARAFVRPKPTTVKRSLKNDSSRLFVSTSPPPQSPAQSATKTTSPSAPATVTRSSPRNRQQLRHTTGGLRKLPVVKPPLELVQRALKVKQYTKANSDVKNARNRARKHGSETLTAFSQALCIPLRDLVQGYKTILYRLHPFERVVADLTARARQNKDGVTLSHVLSDIHEARKEMLVCTKDWIARTKDAPTAREASECMEAGCTNLVQLFEEMAAPSVQQMVELQRSLRTAPAVRLDTPAVVLVGSPNVGKSTIVRAISSGTPEVNNYPFTTRGMTLGHVQVYWKNHEEQDESTEADEKGKTDDSPVIARAIVPKSDEASEEKGTKKKKKRRAKLKHSDQYDELVVSGKYAFSQLCQVMDSPGLLVRETDEERNAMESLTLAAMQHLPTAVMYVMDLSGGAGDQCSSIKDQLALRKQMRARFPRRPWIDVVSKYDLGVDDKVLEELETVLDGAPYIKLSIPKGIAVDELRHQVLRMLGEVQVVLDAMAAVDERTARQSTTTSSSNVRP